MSEKEKTASDTFMRLLNGETILPDDLHLAWKMLHYH